VRGASIGTNFAEPRSRPFPGKLQQLAENSRGALGLGQEAARFAVHRAFESRLALQQSRRVAKDGRQGIAQLVLDCARKSTTKKKRTGGLSRPFFLFRFV
jgi:hypothetical protein